jgi:hypothetical protein
VAGVDERGEAEGREIGRLFSGGIRRQELDAVLVRDPGGMCGGDTRSISRLSGGKRGTMVASCLNVICHTP